MNQAQRELDGVLRELQQEEPCNGHLENDGAGEHEGHANQPQGAQLAFAAKEASPPPRKRPTMRVAAETLKGMAKA